MNKIFSRAILNTYNKVIFHLGFDATIIALSWYLALVLRFDGRIYPEFKAAFGRQILILIIINIVVFTIFKMYRRMWKYAGITDFLQIFYATFIAAGLSYLYGFIDGQRLPRTTYFISWMIIFLAMVGTRVFYRIIKGSNVQGNIRAPKNRINVMIVGMGFTGITLVKEMFIAEGERYPVVGIDDDRDKIRKSVNGVYVAGNRHDIPELVEEYNVEEIVIALPSASKIEIKEIFDICSKTDAKIKIMPALHEILEGGVSVNRIRDVSISDLLGRDEIELVNEEVSSYIYGEVVLVTGGGGSIGSELCRQLVKLKPKQLIIFDIYENNAYDLQQELLRKYGSRINLKVLIGSVRDRGRLKDVFKEYKPSVVFHAAAHKHVPLMEDSPFEAIKNNVLGSKNVAEYAERYGTKSFVLISTDKAVNPTNIMGASKRVTEMIIQNMSKTSKTKFVAVRFGNVLGSNGSVIPLFKKQIENGGPVTVTHPDITRFFMTIPEASSLVIQAGAMAKGGEIFILDMGEPVKIVDLAIQLIKLSGLKPNEDIELEFTGLRPGEKLYEELLLQEEGITATKNKMIYVAKPVEYGAEFIEKLEVLKRSIEIKNVPDLYEIVSDIIGTKIK